MHAQPRLGVVMCGPTSFNNNFLKSIGLGFEKATVGFSPDQFYVLQVMDWLDLDPVCSTCLILFGSKFTWGLFSSGSSVKCESHIRQHKYM